MKRLTNIAGLSSLILMVLGFNVLVLKQDMFGVAVLGPLALGVLLGVLWVALLLVGMARHSAHEGKSLRGLNAVVTSVVFLAICVMIYAFAQHLNRSWDLSKEGRRSLAEQTVQVLQNLDKDVSIIAFFLQTDDELVLTGRDKTARFLDLCCQYTSHLKVEFLDPQIDRLRLEGLNITHASTQGTIVIQRGTRQKVITLSGANPRLEERDFTNTLINVVRDSQPKVCFLTGHGERSIDNSDEKDGASMLKTLLEMEGYTAERIGIKISDPEVPDDCDVLVINGLGTSGPQSDLHPTEIRAIQAFLERGGRLLVLLDPWRKVLAAQNQTEQLLPWLKGRYGIVVNNDLLYSPEAKDRVTVDLTANTDLFQDDPNGEFRGCFNVKHRITQNPNTNIVFSLARSVTLAKPMPDKTRGTPLLRSTPDFYGETDINSLLSSGRATKSASELLGPLTVAVAVEAQTDFRIGDTDQTRDARIVVAGDSDFASNSQLGTIPGNFNFMLNTMAWLTESEELIAIRPSGKQDAPVILSEFDQRMIVYVAVLGTVQAVVAAGLVAYFLRRKYQ